MHPENDAGNSDTDCNEEQTDHQSGIKEPERHCHCERRNRMSGGEGKLVRRQQTRPAMRLQRARPFPARSSLDNEEYRDAGAHRHSGRGNGGETLWSAEQQNRQTPSDTTASHRLRASRRSSTGAPTAGLAILDAPHEPVIASGDVLKHSLRKNCHTTASPAATPFRSCERAARSAARCVTRRNQRSA